MRLLLLMVVLCCTVQTVVVPRKVGIQTFSSMFDCPVLLNS